MAKSFNGLVSDAVSGKDAQTNLVFSETLLANLIASLALQAREQMVWTQSIVQVEPTGAVTTPQTYFRKDENGKCQWVVRFPTGATQVILTEA